MFDAFKKLRLASAFLGHTPEPKGSGSFALRDVLGDLSEKQLEEFGGDLEQVFAQPGVAQLYENHYLPRPESLEVLLDLPRETLGYHYGIYLKRHGLVITAPESLPQSRIDYIRERVRMNHALLHVVTEYDASPTGELALQAFFVGQLGNLASGTIIAAGLLQILQQDPGALGETLAVLAEAYERGRAARSFLGTPWEEFWTAPIVQVRELTGIPPRTSSVAHLDVDRLIAEAAGRDAPGASSGARAGPGATSPSGARERQGTPASARGVVAEAPPPRPEPEPEPAPAPFVEPRRPRRRWAGLDLLSQSSAEPEPPPAPEPTRLRLDVATPAPTPEPAPEPTRLRLDAPTEEPASRHPDAPTTKRRSGPSRLRLHEDDAAIESAETLFDPPTPPPPPPTPPAARSLFAGRDARSPLQAPTIDSRPLDLAPAAAPASAPPSASTAATAPPPGEPEGRRREGQKPRRGAPKEEGGYKEIDSVDEDLPNPGDRDYF